MSLDEKDIPNRIKSILCHFTFPSPEEGISICSICYNTCIRPPAGGLVEAKVAFLSFAFGHQKGKNTLCTFDL